MATHRFARAMLCSVLAVGVAAPRAHATDQAAVTIDLNAATKVATLSFDVPITLSIGITGDLQRIDVYMLPSNVPIPCGETSPFDNVAVNSWQRFIGSTSTTAVVTVPPIDANQYVCFKFGVTRQMTTAEQATFSDSATSAVDTLLRNETLGPSGFDVNQRGKLYLAMRTALQLTAPDAQTKLRRQVKAGTLFDATPSADAIKMFETVIAALFQPVYARQALVAAIVDERGQVATAAKSIAVLVADPFLADFADKISKATDTNRELKDRFQPAADPLRQILNLRAPTLDLLMGHARSVAEGLPPGATPSVRVPDVWDPADVQGRIDLLHASLRQFQAVQTFVVQTQIDAVSPPSSSADLNRLRAEIVAAAGDLAVASNQFDRLGGALASRRAAIAQVIKSIGDTVTVDAFIGASSFADFNTRSQWYLGADVGFGVSPTLNAAFPYVGVNIYFRPVNKESPLALRSSFGRRFSAMIGSTYSADLSKPGVRESTLGGNNMLIVGAGLRLTDILRASAGFVTVRALNTNPLRPDDKRLELAPFVSLSIDWDAKTTFEKAFGSKDQPLPRVPPQ